MLICRGVDRGGRLEGRAGPLSASTLHCYVRWRCEGTLSLWMEFQPVPSVPYCPRYHGAEGERVTKSMLRPCSADHTGPDLRSRPSPTSRITRQVEGLKVACRVVRWKRPQDGLRCFYPHCILPESCPPGSCAGGGMLLVHSEIVCERRAGPTVRRAICVQRPLVQTHNYGGRMGTSKKWGSLRK